MKKCCCLLFLFIASIGMASNAFGRETAPLSAEQVIQALKLVPMSDEACPGFYLPTYESKTRAAVDKDRAAASLIYYLMTPQISIDPLAHHQFGRDHALSRRRAYGHAVAVSGREMERSGPGAGHHERAGYAVRDSRGHVDGLCETAGSHVRLGTVRRDGLSGLAYRRHPLHPARSG